jgi:hypothetical protein
MKYFFLFLPFVFLSCSETAEQERTDNLEQTTSPEIASIQEERFDIRNDSSIFNSGTIENFDAEGNSQTVFWLGEQRDTTLRFYRKYDSSNQLIGAEYYEAGDTDPSRDTVYFDSDGKKVEASLAADNTIRWKSVYTADDRGNPILKSYENGKGEPRGYDSLYFDEQNREIRGFYAYANGKRGSVKTYEYISTDDYGNWTEREMYKDSVLSQRQLRFISYHTAE